MLEELLTPEILANIRLNKDDPYKSGSDGDMFHSVITAIKRGDKAIHLIGTHFANWVFREHGVALSQAARIRTIISNKPYAEIAEAVVNTPWGRKGFVIEHFDKLCTQHVTRVRIWANKHPFIWRANEATLG